MNDVLTVGPNIANIVKVAAKTLYFRSFLNVDKHKKGRKS